MVALAATLACSAGSNEPPERRVGSTGGSGAASPGSGGSLGVGTGGSAAGGAGGSSPVNVDPGAGGAGGSDDPMACEAVAAQAQTGVQGADIIIAVDSSGSMSVEAGFVQQHLNAFSGGIGGAGIDFRVILLSADSTQSRGVCIAPPLGSGACPADNNPPSFIHLPISVASTNALQLIVQNFSQIEPHLRVGATKHVVVVTDDNSAMGANDFDQQFRAAVSGVDPLFSDYFFHAIYGFSDPNDLVCFANPASDPCCTGGIPPKFTASEGTVYRQLVQMKSGAQGNLCLQDFLPVFSAVSQIVVATAAIPCDFAIPPPPAGEQLDPNQVNVVTAIGGIPTDIGQVPSSADCAGVVDGWYYDDPVAPTKIVTCPQTCQTLQGHADAVVQILFGCATTPAVPK